MSGRFKREREREEETQIGSKSLMEVRMQNEKKIKFKN